MQFLFLTEIIKHCTPCDYYPCVVIPTAGGKTPVMATICKDAVTRWQGRVLVLAHVKELLEQTADKLTRICPEVRFGIYSAGLKRRDRTQPVIVAGIQSVYQRACDFEPFDLVLVDEAHLIPPDGDGMYRQFLADARTVNPHLRVVGFTATPFWLDHSDAHVLSVEGRHPVVRLEVRREDPLRADRIGI